MTKTASRKKKSPAQALRPFWLLIGIVAILAAFGGYYAATWPGFFPKSVMVTGNRVVSSHEILARARVITHANVWLQNMRAAAARVDVIPYVKDAQIHRSLPATVRIAVTERTPYAVLRYRSGAVVVDRDLRVLQRLDGAVTLPQFLLKATHPPADGAFVKDATAMRFNEDYAALARGHVIVTSLRYDKFGDLVATMHGGVRLLLGDDADLQKKTPLVGPILSQVAAGGRRIAAVDLRAPKTPVVVYR